MRYTKEHKQAIHARLVEIASQQFRAHGGSISIATLMDALDLTHGGFYRHFASKDELYTEALAFSFEQMAARLLQRAQREGGPPTLQALIERYLSLDHCANRAEGCPVAALSAEIGHQPEAVRKAFDAALLAYIAKLSPLLPGATDAERTRNGLTLFSGMAGVLSVARTIDDEALQAAMLASARELYSKAYCS